MSVLLTEFLSAFDKFTVLVEIDFVVIDWSRSHPIQDLLLAPVVVLVVKVPELSSEMAEWTELFERDEFLVESLVIAFDLTTATWIVWPTEDQFDTEFLSFRFEHFGDKLFSIIEIDFTRNSSGAECPSESIDRWYSIFVKVNFALHPKPWAVIGKTSDIDLIDSPGTKLKSIALPQTVNVTTLESFAGRLGFYFKGIVTF